MKFVIKSLLFVNLLLQITNSLRKCFDPEQNLMLTIILLAFSLIGLIGLSLGNRFILVIFAASTTLILIASITIYAINRVDRTDIKSPNLPYYASSQVPSTDKKPTSSVKASRLKALLVKIEPDQKAAELNATSAGRPLRRRTKVIRQVLSGDNLALKDPDYLDQVGELQEKLTSTTTGAPVASKKKISVASQANKTKAARDGDELNDAEEAKPDPAWQAYERKVASRYAAIVSQSIDLVLQTILASWMALLLDDSEDQCFGGSGGGGGSSSKSGLKMDHFEGAKRRLSSGNSNTMQVLSSSFSTGQPTRRRTSPAQDLDYNYNGVRYSIRPDSGCADAAARLARAAAGR